MQKLNGETLYRNRTDFEAVLDAATKQASLKLPAPVRKAILAALSERDPEAQGVFAGEPNYGYVFFGRDGAMKVEEVSMSEFEQAMRNADSS